MGRGSPDRLGHHSGKIFPRPLPVETLVDIADAARPDRGCLMAE